MIGVPLLLWRLVLCEREGGGRGGKEEGEGRMRGE